MRKITTEIAFTVLDSAPSAVLVLDSGYCCLYANPAAEAFLGVNAAEMIARSLWETFPALHGSAFDTQVTRALTEKKRIPFEFHFPAAARWFDVEVTPLAEGVAIYLSDATDRHRVIDSAPRAETSTTTVATNSGTTVLLVDDDEAMRRVTRRILSRFGFTILEAGNGAEAMQIAEQNPNSINLLVTDVSMPGMRGPDLAARLAESSPGVRVLFISGMADADVAKLGTGQAFLQKPFNPDGFSKAVEGLLGR